MNIERLIKVLIRHEGLRLKPYCDKTGKEYKSPEECGKITIGIGRNLEDLGITEDEAIYLLYNDINRVKKELDNALPWWRNLDDIRQEVLVNMCFNLGLSKLLEFKNFLSALKLGDYNKAGDEMENSLWCKQVKIRCKELVYAMRNGEYPFRIDIQNDKLLEFLNKRVWEDINKGW